MSLYLDASVLVPLIVEEKTSGSIDKMIDAEAEQPFVSALARGELSSALTRQVRMSLMTSDDMLEGFLDFDRWAATCARTIATRAVDVRLADSFVRRVELGLRMPDAIHLATASRHRLTLATLDRRLADAARSLDVAVVVPA